MGLDQSVAPPRSIVTSPGTRSKFRVQHQLRTESAGPQLGRGKIQIILLLELMIGELVARGHADAARISRRIDNVHARDFRLFPAIASICRHIERFIVGAQRKAGAFVEPLGRDSGDARRWPAAFQSPLVHSHAVGDLLARGMHRLPVGGAANVAQSRAAHQAASRFAGMIHRRQYAPLRRAGVDLAGTPANRRRDPVRRPAPSAEMPTVPPWPGRGPTDRCGASEVARRPLRPPGGPAGR